MVTVCVRPASFSGPAFLASALCLAVLSKARHPSLNGGGYFTLGQSIQNPPGSDCGGVVFHAPLYYAQPQWSLLWPSSGMLGVRLRWRLGCCLWCLLFLCLGLLVFWFVFWFF